MAVKKRAALFKKLLSGVCAAVCAVCMAGAALAQEPEAAPLPYRVEALPAGYSAVHEDGQILITDGQQTVGGVVGYPIPDGVYDPYDKWFDWLEDVGIPDYEDGELILDSAISDFRGGWHVNFPSTTEGEPTVRHSHHFTVRGNTVYDAWLDGTLLDETTARAIYEAVQYIRPEAAHKELTISIEGEKATCQTEQVIRRGYSIWLPSEGWPFGDQELIDGIPTDTLEYGENEAIQLRIATLAGKDLTQAQQWVAESWPQYALLEDKQGGVGGTDGQGNVLTASLHCAENVTYAVICLYPQEAAEGGGTWLSAFADTFELAEATPDSAMTEEEADYLKCLAVMGSVGFSAEGDYWLSSEQTLDGTVTTTQYLLTQTGSLVISEEEQDGFYRQAILEAEDETFCNAGHEQEPGEIVWHPCEEEHELFPPAMDSYVWNKHNTRYVGSTADEAGECISYQMMGRDENGNRTPIYSVKFYFDQNGSFIESRWERLEAWAGDFDTAAERIVSTDAQTIEAEVQREYQRAIG